MLDDLLDFAAVMLVDGGRLSFWMPTANDEAVVLGVPTHPYLKIISVCVQTFNKCASSRIQETRTYVLTSGQRVQKTAHLPETTGLRGPGVPFTKAESRHAGNDC